MRNGVESGKPLTMADIGKIKNPGERLFALTALRGNPHLVVIHEPRFFRHKDGDGRVFETLPDFFVQNPDHPESPGIYVEVTRAIKGDLDPKANQRMAMSLAAPEVRYTVLYEEHLGRIERKHPTPKR